MIVVATIGVVATLTPDSRFLGLVASSVMLVRAVLQLLGLLVLLASPSGLGLPSRYEPIISTLPSPGSLPACGEDSHQGPPQGLLGQHFARQLKEKRNTVALLSEAGMDSKHIVQPDAQLIQVSPPSPQ